MTRPAMMMSQAALKVKKSNMLAILPKHLALLSSFALCRIQDWTISSIVDCIIFEFAWASD